MQLTTISYLAKSQPLLWVTCLLIFIIALPIVALFSYLFIPANDVWEHLLETVLANYFLNSMSLSIGVTIGSLILGTSTAWLCSTYQFFGRRFYEWALILPLAYPAYITAYTYTGMLDYGGSIHLWFKEVFDISHPVSIRSLGGAIVVMTFTLYPYIYLLARSAWVHKSNRLLETGKLLGVGPWENFYKIALPVARPAIIAGVAIVIMESLADYGTTQYFGVNTLSVGILKTWFGLNSIESAVQLSVALLVFSITFMIIEKAARRRARYVEIHHPAKPCYKLHGKYTILANMVCAIPIIFGFLIPTVQLMFWVTPRIDTIFSFDYLELAGNTFTLAALTSIIIVGIAIMFSYIKHIYSLPRLKVLIQIISSGYAVPGVVIAVAVLTLSSFVKDLTGIFFASSILGLGLAYCIRFLTLGVNTIDASLDKVSPNLGLAARLLNASPNITLFKIYLPLMKGGLFTALLLIFVDIIKELPATLVLRPFNFNTLAVRTYELASDERLVDASLPALSIVLISLIPLIILARSISRKH